MKSLLLVLPILLGSVPAHAQYYSGEQCNYIRRVYDEYGNLIRSERFYGPCNNSGYNEYYSQRPYNCGTTQTALGALLGGGIAASMSRGNGYAWSVPIGAAIGGAIVGCRPNY